ncbi:MAG: leucyl aminopeptidase, partial [Holosporaceae bacterium]|nr:leucyl aminopeptidase [Holosporaceae bacterium]
KKIEKILQKIDFSGKLFETKFFVSSSDEYRHIVVVGLGEPGRTFTKFELEKLGASIYSAAQKLDAAVTVAIDSGDVTSNEDISSQVAFGFLLKSWEFDKYKVKKKDPSPLTTLRMFTSDAAKSEKSFLEYRNLAEAIFLTRLVVSEPANVIYPESLAEIAKKELLPLGVEVEILNKHDMTALRMNALLGVAQGSANEPKLAVLSWNGANDKSQKPVAFVGKGVTFDSGGISIKPSDNMHDMRHDMAGAGTVLGLVKSVALNKLPVNVVGIMALVENMPSGTAQRPGDIVKSMSGQTIEVLNTDAEGRLVLADALWYTQDRFSPVATIDLATLTGAIVVALGHEFAGLFSNDDELAQQIEKSSVATGEKVWRMPLTDHFDKGIDSDLADMQNIAKPSVRGGSITAAQFLKRFVNDAKWAHIDIAGVETTSDDDVFLCAKGATGFGVYLLHDFLLQNYAK